jgi:phage tail protein X
MAKSKTYTTRQGDTWFELGRQAYPNLSPREAWLKLVADNEEIAAKRAHLPVGATIVMPDDDGQEPQPSAL